MSDEILEVSEPNKFQHKKVLMQLTLNQFLLLEVFLLDDGFVELLLKNKPETGLKFFTFTW